MELFQILLELLISLISALGSSVILTCNQAVLFLSCFGLFFNRLSYLKSNYFSREEMGTFVIFKTRQQCAKTLTLSTAGPGGRVVYLGFKVVDFSPCKMSLLAITYHRGHLEILNQLLLPHESVYEEISCVEDGWQAIRSMKVRFFRGQVCVDDLFLFALLVWQKRFFLSPFCP